MGQGRYLGMASKYTVLLFERKQDLARYATVFLSQKDAEGTLQGQFAAVGSLYGRGGGPVRPGARPSGFHHGNGERPKGLPAPIRGHGGTFAVREARGESLRAMLAPLLLVPLASILFGQARAQELEPFARVDPYTKNDPEKVEKAGYVSLGPFRFGDDHTTDEVLKSLTGFSTGVTNADGRPTDSGDVYIHHVRENFLQTMEIPLLGWAEVSRRRMMPGASRSP